ncbi:NAD(P)-dependent oxidoreductase [Rhodocyclus tenuis]|uniref:NAD(P)-dependent oxidoreductase n=1 Tax=Rhodocyclus gracilis TaxID=2929842 RepID=A0ABX0WFJ3_9RHOO|nr:NAD(P)-dependent oxidoreductase [Rhodocyclus gracilis]NJA88145.1 NAD(P)-dependent oxidoreductase [Rhodocyclus gracilis]
MKVAFIGLGIMGRPMALNLLRGGHAVTVWARRAESMRPLADAGAHTADSPAAAATNADLVISMVADAPDVEQVMLGESGVVDALALRDPGAAPLVAVDMSTIAPAAARRIGERLAAHGISFLDAPVSGGEVGAIAGSLSVMVGGDAAAFAFAQPALACVGSRVLHIGASGAGQVTKAANQILTGVGVLAVAEALNFAACNGVDAGRVREALMGGFASSRILENHGQRMLDRNFAPGFKAWMNQKDLNIVLQSAHQQGVFTPLTAATSQFFNALVGNGLGEEDSIAVLKLLEGLSGVAGKDEGSAS